MAAVPEKNLSGAGTQSYLREKDATWAGDDLVWDS
jgi:hypothetical protein